MQKNYDSDEPEIYFEEEFDYTNHKTVFEETVDDLSDFIETCERSRRIRTCDWQGQNDNLTKSGDNAFPFNGASDSQVWLAHGLMSTSTAININALRRSQIQAYPRKATDVERASQVSVFLKYLRDAGIENFWREAELADNYLKETGLMVTYFGYGAPRMVPHLKRFDEASIVEQAPELAEIIFDPDRIDEVIDIFNSFEGWEVSKKRARKALRQLQKEGVADIPVLVEDDGKPEMVTLSPETEFFCPLATQNFQDSDRCYVRKPMTPQEILARVKSEGWDKDWAQYAVDYARDSSSGLASGLQQRYGEYKDLIDVVFSYERLIDEEDGASGIYLTIWSPDFGEGNLDVPNHAKRMLLSGMKRFPFVVTAPYEAKTLYSATNWSDQLKSIQKSKKVFRDSNIDEQSYAASPALTVSPTWDYGRPQPGGVYSTRPGQPAPSYLSKDTRFDVTMNLEKSVTKEALDLVGQDPESPFSQQKQQHDINRLLSHIAEVLKGVYEAYKMNGPDDLYLRVTGNPQPVEFVKDPYEAEMSVSVTFNSIYDDPEQLKQLRETIVQAAQLDPNGRINMEAGIDMILNSVDPTLADAILLPTEQGQDKIIKETQDAIAKMATGIAQGAPQNAAQLRLSTVDQYIQSPTGNAELQQNPGFQFLLNEYKTQLEFQITQQENAEIGRLGTRPAQMGNINTQNVQS